MASSKNIYAKTENSFQSFAKKLIVFKNVLLHAKSRQFNCHVMQLWENAVADVAKKCLFWLKVKLKGKKKLAKNCTWEGNNILFFG